MAREAWLSGKLEGYSPLLMPAAHALVQAAIDLRNAAADLSGEELCARPNGAPSVAFHLKHIAGSIDRLLTYARGGELNEAQFAFLRAETTEETDETAAELVRQAAGAIETALAALKESSDETLFAPRHVGREKLETNRFGLLVHVAEHTMRHTGQVVTTAKIVKNNLASAAVRGSDCES